MHKEKPMQSFKEFVQEAHVYDGIHTEIKKDRIDFHHGGELVHSQKGDFSNPSKLHQQMARGTATRVHLAIKNKASNPNSMKPNKFTLNYGKME